MEGGNKGSAILYVIKHIIIENQALSIVFQSKIMSVAPEMIPLNVMEITKNRRRSIVRRFKS